jgi:ubiquinone/menaquinone biosynthesis C-methylase UbiE
MREYYEELWEGLPPELEPPDWALRSGWLRDSVQPGDRALDLGCGAGVFLPELRAAGAATVAGADVADAALARARARDEHAELHRVPFDGPLPFTDGSFDVVWASEVLEHVADTATFLSEARRVLTPRGRLVVTTPSHGRWRLLLGGIEPYSEPLGDHLHLYTARSLRTLLAQFGFTPTVRAAAGPPGLRRLLLARGGR